MPVTRRALVIAALVACGSEPAKPRAIANVPPGAPPIALAIVYAGQILAIGDADYENIPGATLPGILHSVERAIDELPLPAGSEVEAIAYSTKPTIAMPWTPASRARGAMLGKEIDYRQFIGSDVVVGITLALDELAHRNEPRKLLVVIGDGNDTSGSLAIPALVDRKARASREGVATHAIILSMPISPKGESIDQFAEHSQTIGSAGDIPAALAAAVRAP